jgi:septal ring factor EnvC (AmiA/AmiB activator)
MAALGLNTKNTIKAFADNLKKHHLIGEELQVALARKERLWELDGLVERNAEVLEAAASVLFGNERVQKELHEKVTADTDRLKREEERKIAEELKGKKADLDETERKIREQKGRLKKLEKDCRTAEAQLEKKTGPYTAELAKKLEEVAKEPHKAFSELAFLRSIFGGMAWHQPMAVRMSHLYSRRKMLQQLRRRGRIDEAGKSAGWSPNAVPQDQRRFGAPLTVCSFRSHPNA